MHYIKSSTYKNIRRYTVLQKHYSLSARYYLLILSLLLLLLKTIIIIIIVLFLLTRYLPSLSLTDLFTDSSIQNKILFQQITQLTLLYITHVRCWIDTRCCNQKLFSFKTWKLQKLIQKFKNSILFSKILFLLPL